MLKQDPLETYAYSSSAFVSRRAADTDRCQPRWPSRKSRKYRSVSTSQEVDYGPFEVVMLNTRKSTSPPSLESLDDPLLVGMPRFPFVRFSLADAP